MAKIIAEFILKRQRTYSRKATQMWVHEMGSDRGTDGYKVGKSKWLGMGGGGGGGGKAW